MNSELFAFAFTAGTIAFFNPCGVAMLPAYVSYYLGRRNESTALRRSWWRPALGGLALGLTVSAGFFTVFIAAGLVFSVLGTAIAQYIPWMAAVFGLGLIVLGLLMLLDKAPNLFVPLPKIQVEFKATTRSALEDFRTFYLYGIGYAVASVGCTIPIFLVVLLQAFAGGFLSGLINFSAYALGMTVMMLALSLVTAYSKELIRRYLRHLMPYVTRISGLVLIGAGSYLIYYQLMLSGNVSL
jgi:cytochrome c biogenesis protein CcdA